MLEGYPANIEDERLNHVQNKRDSSYHAYARRKMILPIITCLSLQLQLD